MCNFSSLYQIRRGISADWIKKYIAKAKASASIVLKKSIQLIKARLDKNIDQIVSQCNSKITYWESRIYTDIWVPDPEPDPFKTEGGIYRYGNC